MTDKRPFLWLALAAGLTFTLWAARDYLGLALALVWLFA
jgi:hypothetical protein